MENFPFQWLWIGLFIFFVIIEAATVGLVTIWFAIASLISLLLVFLGFSYTVQIFVFIISSILLLIFTRPVLKKYVYKNKTRTNVDSMIGKTALVSKPIREHDFGEVKIDGQIWSAISENGEDIDSNTNVQILGVKGVKLIVKKC